jgi:two-component system, OmpR family, response regulator VicR
MPEPLKILVVDDEAAIRGLLVDVLHDAHFVVLTAANGRAAVEVAARERPDLILMDIMMPELDGPGAIRCLRALPELEDVPIVLMSAGDGSLPSDIVTAALIPKPFHLDHVLTVLADVLHVAKGREPA